MATSTAPEEVDEATRRQAWADYYKKLEEYNASSNAYAQQQQQQQQQQQAHAAQWAAYHQANAGQSQAHAATGYNSYSAYYQPSSYTGGCVQQAGHVIGGSGTAPQAMRPNAYQQPQQHRPQNQYQQPAAAAQKGVGMSAVQLNMQASLQAAAAHVEAKVRSQQYSAAAAGAAAVARLPQAQVPKVQFNMAGRGAGCSSSAASPFGSSRTASLPTQSTPAPAPAASGDPWPASLRAWVERAFAQCKSDLERGVVGEHLRKTIQAVDVWRHDWEREPLPPRKKELWLPVSSGLSFGRDEQLGPSGPQLGGKKKRRKAGKGWASETHDTHAGARPDSREEQSKRARRASRFEASGLSLEQRADLARADRWAAAPQQPGCQPGGELGGDIELDFTVAGTSTTVEKKYLRLTSAPDPRTVRPEPLLKQAIDRVRGRLIEFGDERGQEQYIYLWEQMKSVRQDLTVQRIRNDFTVGVYEMHARICLEYDDQAELKQCQAQLQQLYEEGLGSREGQREFLAYSLLYNVGKQADNNVADLMKDLSADDRSDKYISHALQVRAAAQLGNYCAFFRLYSDAPGHSGYVMDTFIGRERFAALRRICRAYQPSVPLAAVSDALAFDDAAECGEWAEDHGATLAEERSYLDCKASKGQLVEHSIAAKREEERKAAERRAEATGGLKGWS